MPAGQDIVALGADLAPGTLLSAYRHGCFPMPVEGTIGWFSPEHRGVLVPSELRVSRSLRRSVKRFSTTINQAFDQVIVGCADPTRVGCWIDKEILDAYTRLHEMGWVHSVEVWDGDTLAGGLYGLGMGSFFAGESMFHRATDASKVALCALIDLVAPDVDGLVSGPVGEAGTAGDPILIDVQWLTPHLASLGASEIPRSQYRTRLEAAVATPGPFPVPDGFTSAP